MQTEYKKTFADADNHPPLNISDEEDILIFGKSEEDAKKHYKDRIINHLKNPLNIIYFPYTEEQIDNFKKEIDNPDTCICKIGKIVSPWN